MDDPSLRSFWPLVVSLVLLGCEESRLPAPLAVPSLDASTAPDEGPSVSGESLYERLGGEAGVTTIVMEFAEALHADLSLAPYFTNARVDGERLATCLVRQVSAVTGGLNASGRPIRYPGTDGRCRDMRTIHAGMGITFELFDLSAVSLVASLVAHGATDDDLIQIGRALRPVQDEIVSQVDPEGELIAYHRLGGYPAIEPIVDDFVTRVQADDAISHLFDHGAAEGGAALRFKVCLARQLCMVSGGPCLYGQETDALTWRGVLTAGAPDGLPARLPVDAVSREQPCEPMVFPHLVHPGAETLDGDDFLAFSRHLIQALEAASVQSEDVTVVLRGLRQSCRGEQPDAVDCLTGVSMADSAPAADAP